MKLGLERCALYVVGQTCSSAKGNGVSYGESAIVSDLLKEKLLQHMSLHCFSVAIGLVKLGYPVARQSKPAVHANSLTRLSQLNINNGVAWLLIIVQLCPNGFNVTQKTFEKLFRHFANQVNRC